MAVLDELNVDTTPLATGNFSRIFAAVTTTTSPPTPRAVKFVDATTEAALDHMLNEVSILAAVAHPNVITILAHGYHGNEYYVAVMPRVGQENATLFDAIVAWQTRCAWSLTVVEGHQKKYLRQLLEAVCYLHSVGVSHRDLKPDNVLLDARGRVTLIDFGFALKDADPSKPAKQWRRIGTIHYVAPDVIRDVGYLGAQADMWSLGVILYTMLTGHPAFPNDLTTVMDYHKQIGEAQKRGRSAVDTICSFYNVQPPSGVEKDLVDKLLSFEPSARITAAAALQHPWLIPPAPMAYRSLVAAQHSETITFRSLSCAAAPATDDDLTDDDDEADEAELEKHGWRRIAGPMMPPLERRNACADLSAPLSVAAAAAAEVEVG